jgi:predicted phage terminase large subunit-like protein
MDLHRRKVFHQTVLRNPWIPKKPFPKQARFLLSDEFEVLMAGGGGSGKSEALLAAALQYVHVPGYAALMIRRTSAEAALPGALMDRSKHWLWGTGAKWNGKESCWRFPSGAVVQFGFLEHENDLQRYKSAEFQYLCFDELTAWPHERTYTFLFSRVRSTLDLGVPLRIRAGSNPGGPGHEWVRKRFIPDEALRQDLDGFYSRCWKTHPKRLFVPARMQDNPALDVPAYVESLSNLDPVERDQILYGDWKAHAGGRFLEKWWRRYRYDFDVMLINDARKHGTGAVEGEDYLLWRELPTIITVDPANRPTKDSKYTAMGVFADMGGQRVAVLDMVRERFALQRIVPELDALCARWRPSWVGIEANGFQLALVNEARDSSRYPNIPTVHELDPIKSKLHRATPAILRAEHGLIYLPEQAPWLEDFQTELQQFTGEDELDTYVDQVDVLAWAVHGLDRFDTTVGGRPTVVGSYDQYKPGRLPIDGRRA